MYNLIFIFFSKNNLQDILKFIKDEEEYNSLNEIIQNEEKFRSFELENKNFIDVFKQFKSLYLNFIEFYSIIPKISVSFNN